MLHRSKYFLRHNILNKSYFSIRYLKYKCGYSGSLPKFYDTIQVNPQRINYFVYPSFYTECRIPALRDGSWDQPAKTNNIRDYSPAKGRKIFPINEYDLYNAIENHFNSGIDWEDTDFYSVACDKIKQGTFWHGCSSKSDIEDRFVKIDELYHKMRECGYMSAQERGDPISEEVTINIGREGSLFMEDGRHRLFIAKVLGIDKIPVWVLVRHKSWQDKRESAYISGKIPERWEPHPDMADLREGSDM